MVTELCNSIVKEGCIPKDWKSDLLLPVYKRRMAIFHRLLWVRPETPNASKGEPLWIVKENFFTCQMPYLLPKQHYQGLESK